MRGKRFLTPKHRRRVLQKEKHQRQQLQALYLRDVIGPEPEPEPEPPSHLEQAYELARQVYVDHPDRKMMRRLDNALALARAGKVKELGHKVFDVNGYTVDQKCTCQDYYWNSAYTEGWCKHRLAVALTLKAQALEKEEAGHSADVQPQQTEPAQDPKAQIDDSTDFDLTQVFCFRPLWGGATGTGITWPDSGGKVEKIQNLDFATLAARADALGWNSCGQDMYLNPQYEIHQDERKGHGKDTHH